MKSVFLVRSEHLNHQHHLFGGALMAEIDTVGYCLLLSLFPRHQFVTRAAEIRFDRPARLGDAIEFEARLVRQGNTSVQVQVVGCVRGKQIGAATMIYVNVGRDGRKTRLAKQPVTRLVKSSRAR